LGDCFAELGSEYFMVREGYHEKPFAWTPLLRSLLLNSTRLSPALVGDMNRAIRRYKPKFLKGMASALYFFALSLKECGITDINFKAVFSTGEMMTPQYRSAVEDFFHCPVLDSYGHMERTVAISQCMDGGYHINTDYGLLELEDAQEGAYGTGSIGKVIGTSLYNRSMPFLRYDVGDTIELSSGEEACPCGRSFPLVKAIHGRNADVILTPDGRFVTSLLIVPGIMKGIRFIQFMQEEVTEIVGRVLPSAKWNDDERDKLMVFLKNMLGPAIRIRIEMITENEIITESSGKRRVVISKLKI
jgi:phenylacetate-CoA ligase